MKLLERTPRRVYLTEAGCSIYGDAQRLFEFSQDAIVRARRVANTMKTSFRVGMSMLNPCTVFMELWQEMSDEFPQYTLWFVPFEDNRAGILSEIELLGKKFDFMIATCDSESWLKHCNFYKLGEYHLCCAVPKNLHLL